MEGQNILTKAAMTVDMKPTTFKTGSEGFRGQGKVNEGGARYQVTIMAVRVGSKPGSTREGG